MTTLTPPSRPGFRSALTITPSPPDATPPDATLPPPPTPLPPDERPIVRPLKPMALVAAAATTPRLLPTTSSIEIKPEPAPPASPPRLVVGPFAGTSDRLDISERVVRLIAQEIWSRSGGNDVLNWLEAERLFQDALHRLADRPVRASLTVKISDDHVPAPSPTPPPPPPRRHAR